MTDFDKWYEAMMEGHREDFDALDTKTLVEAAWYAGRIHERLIRKAGEND